ncbi:MAG: hypothetical protein ACEPO2_07010 [Pelagibaca sp.]
MRISWIATAALLFVLGVEPVAAQMMGGGHMHGQGGMAHDMSRMPGLQGENATPEESADLALMFRGFQTMTREVENLPNGIRTVTRSSDPQVMDALVNHTVGMIDRVGRRDDPKIRIQSPTLDLFFLRGDRILSEIDVTEDGIVVIQTSDDPELVAALHEHAAEVTAMVEQGMHAVHMMMMQRAAN